MPSDRKQINVRIDAEGEDLVARLIPAVSAALGMKVNQSDLFRLGMAELARKYLAAAPAQQVTSPPPPPPAPAKGNRRKRSG